MGQDQHAAGSRSLDEAERRDGLAGPRGVLEPEALGRVRILGLLGELLLVLRALAILLLIPADKCGFGLGAVELGLELRGHVVRLEVVLLFLVRGSPGEFLVVFIVVLERGIVFVV
jgi:hypothetical protein